MLPYLRTRITGAIAILLLGAALPSAAQILYLEESQTGENAVEADVGDIVEVEVWADLGRYSAAGIALYVRVPRGPFEVIDSGKKEEICPFIPGNLFQQAVEAGNTLASGAQIPNVPDDQQLLSYAIILGPGTQRGKTGSGVVARFLLRCLRPVDQAQIALHSNPIHETRLVLDDGFTEQYFSAMQGLDITVDHFTAVTPNTWGTVKKEIATAD